jgi:Integrase core domain
VHDGAYGRRLSGAIQRVQPVAERGVGLRGSAYRAPIDDGGALAMETARFRDSYNRIRPHQALDERTPRRAYLDT